MLGGDSALVFEKFYNPNKVYAFEPEIKNYNLMLETIKRNNLNRVIPIRIALGNKEDVIRIKDFNASSYISDNGENEIKMTTIDKFVDDKNLSVGLIKMDIEGYELNAVKGAENTVKKFKPVLLISIYHNGKEFFEIPPYIKKLNLYYRYIIRKLSPLKPFYETVLIVWDKSYDQ